MANSYLPQEITFEIFSRLPAKSIGRCRCLSKQWRTLLSTPHFIKHHLSQNSSEENLILITPSFSIHTITHIKRNSTSTILDLPPINCTQVVGSCHGLVLLSNDDVDKVLVNPVTLQYVRIPDSPVALHKDDSYSMLGFGYDEIHDDYKVVVLSYFDTEYEPNVPDTFVDVYSVKTGVWRSVDCSPYDHAIDELPSGAFVNGAIHWIAHSRHEEGYPSVIAAFRLADDVFVEIPSPPAPSDVDCNKFVFNQLLVFDGCLCMMDTLTNGTSILTEVWIMKEYGVGESWTKLRIDSDYDWDILKPLCFINDQIVSLSEGQNVVFCDPEDETFWEMGVDGVSTRFIDGGVFVPSLISPSMWAT